MPRLGPPGPRSPWTQELPQKEFVTQTRPIRAFLDFSPGASEKDVLPTSVANLIE